MRRTLPLALVAVPVALVAACSSSSGSGAFHPPATGDFAAGACRTSAADIVALGRGISQIGDTKKPAASVLTALQQAQTRLDAARPSFGPSLQGPVQGLVVSVGAVRLRAALTTYEPSVGKTAMGQYDALVKACTGKGAQGS